MWLKHRNGSSKLRAQFYPPPAGAAKAAVACLCAFSAETGSAALFDRMTQRAVLRLRPASGKPR